MVSAKLFYLLKLLAAPIMETAEVIAQSTAPLPSYLSPVAKVDRMMPTMLRNEACKRLVPTGERVRSFGKFASVRNLAIAYFADESFQNSEQMDRRGFRFSTYAYAAIQRSMFGALRRRHRQQRGLLVDGHELTASAIGDASSADRQCLEAAEARHEVQRLLQVLEPREREILLLRFGFGADSQPVSFQAIAQQIGLSKQRVASLYQEIMTKLRSAIGTAAA